MIKAFLSGPSFTVRELSRLTGLLDATASVVPFGQWRVRPLHWFRALHWDQSSGNYDIRLQFDRSFPVQDLLWWNKPKNLLAGVPLHVPPPDVTMFSDASMEGWGAHAMNLTASGLWPRRFRRLHINELELRAVLRGLQSFLPCLEGKTVLVQPDNTTALAYIRREVEPTPANCMQ
jgi:hypothetical protein